MRLTLAIVLSVAVHGGAALALVGFAMPRPAEPPHLVPLDVAEAPAVPPPPEVPSAPPGPPKPPRPKRRARVHVASAGLPVAVADAGVEVQHGDDEPDAGMVVEVNDAGPPAKLDPAVLDLRAFLPPGERVILVLRGDRLRATPWAAAVEAVLAPMPDHRVLIAGTGLGVAETFDTVVIASPAPRDLAQTFLAGRTERDEAELRRALARGGRVSWGPVAGGTLGRRQVAAPGDPRVLLVPAPGWFLLVRPEHVPDLLAPTPAEATPPPWLGALTHIDDQTGDAATLAVVVVADLGVATLQIAGLPPLPAPDRLTLAVTADEKGLILTGAAVFADEAQARAFRDGVLDGQRDLLASLGRRLFLRSYRADGAVTRLQLALHGASVGFATSLTNAEALGLLEQAAALSRRYFLGDGPHTP